MKKVFFLLVFFAMMAITVTAQTAVTILNPDTTKITMDSIPSNGTRIGGTGSYHVRGNYRVQGSNTWYHTDTVTFTAGVNSFSKGFGGLQASTTYELSYTAFNAGGDSSMTTPIKVATTKPLPQVPTVFFLDTVPGLPKSGFVIAASSVGYPSYVYGINANTGVIVTDSVMVTGNSTDTVFAINTPGQYIPEMIFVIVPIASAVNATQSANTSPPFYAPTYSLPQITTLAATVIYIDSVKITAYDVVGNGGPVVTQTQLYDSVGALLYQWPNQILFSSGNTSVSKTVLKPGTKYVVKHTISTPGVGQDTASVSFYTLPVPAASLSVDSTAKTKTTVDLYFGMVTNGSWNGSIIDSLVVFKDGVLFKKVYQPIGTATSGSYLVSVTGLVPGTTHSYTAYVRNKFGIITWISTFNVTTIAPAAAFTPQWGYLQQEGPTKISLNLISYQIPSGTIGELWYTKRMVYPSTTVWDTASFASGLITAGTLQQFVVNGLQAASKYEFQIFGVSQDGAILANSTVNWELTASPQQPKINTITIAQLTQQTVSGEVVGEANGTDAEESHALYEVGNNVPIQSSATTPVGMDSYTVPYSFSIPTPGAYEIRAKIAQVGDINPYGLSKFFNNGPNGLEEVSFDDLRPMLLSRAWNLSDPSSPTLLGEGYTLEEAAKMFPSLIVALEPMDDYYRKTFGGKIYFPQR